SQYCNDGAQSGVFGGGATMTPITPFDEDGWSATPIDPQMPPPRYRKHEPTLPALKEPVEEEAVEVKKEDKEAEPRGVAEKQPPPSTGTGEEAASGEKADDVEKEVTSDKGHVENARGATPLDRWAEMGNALEGVEAGEQEPSQTESEHHEHHRQ